jgi:uncharacterized tellurite resistance protein B-like protein
MLGSLKTLVTALVGKTEQLDRFEDHDCRLATAALLIRAATIDDAMSDARRDKLRAVLKSHFGLNDAATAELIEKGVEADREAVDLYHFTRRISTSLDDEGRRRIVEMMWEIIYADGAVSGPEDNIVWRVADLLAVSSRQRIELRRRVAAERTLQAGECGAPA